MKKREESAFGIHFDFHARHGMCVAQVCRPELVGRLLDRVKPDYVQFDTKGHAGLSSYPTKVGEPADSIAYDMLSVWREETKIRDIALYAHHSGLYDMHVAQTHPQWAVVDTNGNVSTEFLSVFSPYADEVLIPQIKELAREYALDGVWVDGDCWALYADYSPLAQEAYAAQTGITTLPKPGDAGYRDFLLFNEKCFKHYIAHYIREIKSEFPDFQITSNWVFSAFMPEKVSVPVDFLSGDYESSDSVNSARYHGRLFAMHDYPWDLMSWGQNTHKVDWREENRQNKEPVQLMQEASVCIALGGGFEFFDIMYGYGGLLQEWCIEGWGEVADFVRDRESVCFRSKPVNEIGVLYTNSKPKSGEVYQRAHAPCDILLSLQDAQFSTQMLCEDYVDRLSEFAVILLPAAEVLRESTVAALKSYVHNGGKLIVDLPSAHYFSDVYKVEQIIKDQLIYVDGCGRLAALESDVCFSEDTTDVQMYLNNYYEAKHYAAYKKVHYGKGMFVFQMFDLGKSCRENRSAPYTNYLNQLVRATGFVPSVRVSSRLVDVTLMTKDGKLLVNLINMCGAHNEQGVRSFSEIPPLTDLQVEIDYPNPPKCVKIEPDNDEIQYTYDGKTIRLNITKLPIHSIIAIK